MSKRLLLERNMYRFGLVGVNCCLDMISTNILRRRNLRLLSTLPASRIHLQKSSRLLNFVVSEFSTSKHVNRQPNSQEKLNDHVWTIT